MKTPKGFPHNSKEKTIAHLREKSAPLMTVGKSLPVKAAGRAVAISLRSAMAAWLNFVVFRILVSPPKKNNKEKMI